MSVQATSKKRPHHNFVQQRLIANAPRESKSLALENEKGLERTRSCGSLPQCRTFPWKLLPPCTCEWPCALPISSSHALYASCHAFQNKLGTVSRYKSGGELAVEYSGKSKKSKHVTENEPNMDEPMTYSFVCVYLSFLINSY